MNAQTQKPNAFGPDAYFYYQEHPAEFVRDMILRTHETGMDLTPEQEKFLNLVFRIKLGLEKTNEGKNKFGVTMPAGHGVGKTTGLAMLILTWLYLWPTSKIPVTSTKKEQLADNLWPEMAKLLEKSALKDEIEWQKTKIYIKGQEETRFAVARTGSTQEALQGFHDVHLLFIVEEASGVENQIFEPVEGALTNDGAVMVLAGNPTKRSGYFFDSFTSDNRFIKIQISCIYPDGTPHMLVSPDYPERMKAKYGEDSSIYRVRVLGLPPKADDDSVIPYDWVMQAVEMSLPDNKAYRTVWGLDVARFGDDRTCLLKRKGRKILGVTTWAKYDTQQTSGRVIREYNDTPKEERPLEIFVDDVGVGGGVYDPLYHAGMPVTPVNAGWSATDEGFHRLRDELWWRTREWFETLAVDIPDHEDLIKELTVPKFKYSPQGKIAVEQKSEFKKRLNGHSPDHADALILTFFSAFDLTEDHQLDAYADDDDYENNGVTWMGV